ncbi:RNA-guided endonuclease InsQ/TnpB family protein [Ktedonosporobacter rubrisoli]|uniref:RNA-guided endonuclease InsQ/TnpB family protein n=1 Tax=Ktedonosporobacter rubrisoli TaxID=2509675 RepID=UPI001F5C151D|nr:transposase [Ktedonosporobacter rubrisoli]
MCKQALKFRLSPNKAQEKMLFWTLSRCRELYNAGLSERRDSYKYTGKGVTYYEQKRDLPEIKAMIRPEYQNIHSQVLQDVLNRLDKAYKAFFRRIQNGEKPGHPRFQGRNRYTSFTYTQGGYTLFEKHVTFSKIGKIKCKFHRQIGGTVKTATIKYEAGQWYVVFACERPEGTSTQTPYTDEEIGIDLGLLHFATLSTGDTIEKPQHFRKGEADLRRKQRHLSRCKRGSHRREKAKKAVAKAHRKIRNQRHDFLHQASRQLVNTYETIVFEDLASSNLSKRPKPKQDEETGRYLPNGASAKSGLNKSILDAGWSTFVMYCSYKAEWARNVQVHQVDPYKTSQICSQCGKEGPHKDLGERTHTCVHCGAVLDRDHNAAINILSGWKSPTVRARLRGKRECAVEAPTL